MATRKKKPAAHHSQDSTEGAAMPAPAVASAPPAPKRTQRAKKKTASLQRPAPEASVRSTPPGRVKPARVKAKPASTAKATAASKAKVKPARKAKAAPPVAVRIFQVFQDSGQLDFLDPGFTAMDQTRRPAELPELTLPQAFLDHEDTRDAALWGIVSWRFTELTGMTSADLHQQLQNHPGADVYCVNPNPADEAVFQNAWFQGETLHPGFLPLAQAALEAAKLDPLDALGIESLNTPGTGLIVAATPAFWGAYLPYLQKFVRQTRRLNQKQLTQLIIRAKDDHALLNNGSVLGMLIRRLLPTFLKGPGKAFKAHHIALPKKEQALNVHQQQLREMKDNAHRSRSGWLATCWVNYRNLYLNQSRGPAWCLQHLKNITPGEPQFSQTG